MKMCNCDRTLELDKDRCKMDIIDEISKVDTRPYRDMYVTGKVT